MAKNNANRIHPNDPLWEQALALHQRAIVIDTHSDLPMKMLDKGVDMGARRKEGHEDIPRMQEGGLDVQFLAIYVGHEYAEHGGLKRMLEMLEPVYAALDKYADRIALATSPSEIYKLKREGKIAAVLALEGGHALEGSLNALRLLYRLGFRYMTLTHIKSNALSDSSTDAPKWNGLSTLGKQMVHEMNGLGMMVDVSHISDKAFWDVLKTSSAPVLATHSSVKSLADWPRNMRDDMIKALAEHGGIIQLCFGSTFLHTQWAARGQKVMQEIRQRDDGDIGYWYKRWTELQAQAPLPTPTVDDLIAHIDHVVKLVGPEHTGLGSDFDGVAHVPKGLDDARMLPNITFSLLKIGYTETDIEKILGGNVLRVWGEVEKAAAVQ